MAKLLAAFFPYRMAYRHGLFNTMCAAPVRRMKLYRRLAAINKDMDDSITVVIGIRNRGDYRLRNALWSLKHQDYPDHLVRIVVVDYGSIPEHLASTVQLCDRFGATCVSLLAQGGWNKPKCLNYAIKRTNTKFLLSSDVDVIFPTNYLKEMVSLLKRKPLSVVYSRMLDLPEDSVNAVRELDELDLPIPLNALLELATARGAGHENAGINGTYTFYYQYLRGYDEIYEGWGSEDNDLMKRFFILGLDITSIYAAVSYLHQWHPKGEGITNFHESARKNREYCERTHSIVRNLQQWGEVE